MKPEMSCGILPKDYDKNKDVGCPVIYLLHGRHLKKTIFQSITGEK